MIYVIFQIKNNKMMKLIYLFVLLCVFIVGISGQGNTVPTYYVQSTPIVNYNPTSCGNNLQSPCNSIGDAVYSFLNQTTNNSTHFVVNLLPGVYLNTTNTYGLNDTVSLYGLNVTFQGYDPVTNGPSSNVIITGRARQTGTPIFKVDSVDRSSSDISFRNIIFDQASSDIFEGNSMGLTNVLFSDCTFRGSIGQNNNIISVYSYNSAMLSYLTLVNCNFNKISNTYIVKASNSNLNVVNSTFVDNNAFMLMKCSNTNVNITSSVFSNNTVSLNRYVLITISQKYINIVNSVFSNNSADGVVYTTNSAVYVNNSNFTNNYATTFGAVYSYAGSAVVSNSYFTRNYSPTGAGVFIYTGTASISNCKFDSNQANYGSAIYAQYQARVTIDSSIFVNYMVPASKVYYSVYSLVYLTSNTRATITNSSIIYDSGRIAPSFTLVSCYSSFISYNSTAVITNGVGRMACSSCSVTHSNLTSSEPSSLYCTSGNDANSSSEPTTSSSSDDQHRKKHYVYEAYRITLIVLISFFLFLLVVGCFIIIGCLVKQRNECRSSVYHPLSPVSQNSVSAYT